MVIFAPIDQFGCATRLLARHAAHFLELFPEERAARSREQDLSRPAFPFAACTH